MQERHPFGNFAAVGRMMIRKDREVVRDRDQRIGTCGTTFCEICFDLRTVKICLADLRFEQGHPFLPS